MARLFFFFLYFDVFFFFSAVFFPSFVSVSSPCVVFSFIRLSFLFSTLCRYCFDFRSIIAQLSSAQHSAISHAQSSEACACRSDWWNAAGKVGESQYVVDHLQLAVFSKPTKKSNSARPKKKTKHKQLVTDARRICPPLVPTSISSCSLSHIFEWCMHAASGMFSWSMELLAFATSQFAPNYGPLSASFTMFFVLLFPCQRA